MIFSVNNRTATLRHLKFIIIIHFITIFPIQIMFSLTPPDANNQQGLMRR